MKRIILFCIFFCWNNVIDACCWRRSSAATPVPMEGVEYTGAADAKMNAEHKIDFEQLSGALNNVLPFIPKELIKIVASYQYLWRQDALLRIPSAEKCSFSVERLFATPTHLIASYGTTCSTYTWRIADAQSHFLAPGKFESGCAMLRGQIILLQIWSNDRLKPKIFAHAEIPSTKNVNVDTGPAQHDEPKQVCAISDTEMAFGLADGQIGFWDLKQTAEESKRIKEERENTAYIPPAHPSPVTALCRWGNDELLVGTFNGKIRRYNLETESWQGEQTLRPSMPVHRIVAMPRSSKVVIVQGIKDTEKNKYSREMKILDMKTGAELMSINSDNRCLDVVPMSRTRIAYGAGTGVDVFDIEKKQHVYTLSHDSYVTCLTKAGHDTLAVGLINGGTKVWKKTVCSTLKQMMKREGPKPMECS